MKTKTSSKKRPAMKAQRRILSPLRVGQKVLIRSVTNYYSGRVVLMNRDEVVLEDAAWIADTGRFSECLKSGTFNEIEPYPDGKLVSIGRGAICDSTNWDHELPRMVK